MPEVTLWAVPVRNPRIEEAPLQTELMLFDPETSKFFVLNSTMAFLWQNADGNRSLGDLTQLMATAFRDTDASRVGADIFLAAEEMRGLGLFVDSPLQHA